MAEQNPRGSERRLHWPEQSLSPNSVVFWRGGIQPGTPRWEREYVPRDDAEALARAVSASLTHGEHSPLEAALTVYLSKHPWSDL